MDRGLAHSHIQGLGIDRAMNATDTAGLFGMEQARKAASIFADMVINKKIAGKALLITGESGSGKTALAVGLSRELGPKVPFVTIAGSEVYSAEIKKTEVLQQAIRRATVVRIREIKRVYEGEVISIQIEEKEDPLNNYRKTISQSFISLRSAKGSQRLTLSPSISQQILRQKITAGDIIYIEADDEIVKKIGRSDMYASEFDIESNKYMPIPRGDIYTKREVLQEMTLHEIDVANAKPKGHDIPSIVNQIARPGRVEITDRLREEVNRKVSAQLSTGAADIIPGVLFIDESHTLDVESYAFLSTAIESPSSPIIVFATNRKLAPIPGSGDTGMFGMPRDFLSRLFVVHVPCQSPEQTDAIVRRKLSQDGFEIEDAGLEYLCSLSRSTSLRFVFSLVSIASALLQADGEAPDQKMPDTGSEETTTTLIEKEPVPAALTKESLVEAASLFRYEPPTSA